MMSLVYFNLAQSQKLVQVALEREANFMIYCQNSLQPWPHLNSGEILITSSTGPSSKRAHNPT
jgi:hypothetical protein